MGLSRIFNSNVQFRDAVRIAARNDFFVPDETLSEQANLILKDPRSTLMSSWKRNNDKNNLYESLTKIFQDYDVNISGPQFISGFTQFCSDSPDHFGSWIDICGVKGKHVSHSWHQDSGLDQVTVMLGFPPHDNYDGIGVFSHAFKISHRLPPPLQQEPRLWVCSSNSFPLGDLPSRVPEEYIIRPVYREGKEVMVYTGTIYYVNGHTHKFI